MGNTNELPSKPINEPKVPNFMKKASGVLAVSVGLAGVPGESRAMNTEPVRNLQGPVQQISGMPSAEYVSIINGQATADVNRLRSVQQEVESLANSSSFPVGLGSAGDAEVSYMITKGNQSENTVEFAQPVTSTLENLLISKAELEAKPQAINHIISVKENNETVKQLVLHSNRYVYETNLTPLKNPDGSDVKNPDGTGKKVFSEYKVANALPVPMENPRAIGQITLKGPILVGGENKIRSAEMALALSLDDAKTFQNVDLKSFGITSPGVIHEIVGIKDESNPNLHKFILNPNFEGTPDLIVSVDTTNNSVSAMKTDLQPLNVQSAKVGGGFDTQILSSSNNTIKTVAAGSSIIERGVVIKEINTQSGLGTKKTIGADQIGFAYGTAITSEGNILTSSASLRKFFEVNPTTEELNPINYMSWFNKDNLPNYGGSVSFNGVLITGASKTEYFAQGAYQNTAGQGVPIIVHWKKDSNPATDPNSLWIKILNDGAKSISSQKNFHITETNGNKYINVVLEKGVIGIEINEDGTPNKTADLLYPDKKLGETPDKFSLSLPATFVNKSQ